ncbi:hypothetical protein AMTRI_Chr13g118990 [Amborella trichopoda]
MQSAYTPSPSALMLLLHFQTALLHLNPLPNPICQTLSPFFILPLASISSITAFPPACMHKCSKRDTPTFRWTSSSWKHRGRHDHQHHSGCAQHAPNGTLRGGSRGGGSRAGGRHPPSERDSLGGAWIAGCRCTSLG